jgi:hypothetical protein
MTRTVRNILVAFVSIAALVASSPAVRAQSRPVSVTDQRNTQRTIRTINKTADAAELGLTRLATNVDTLLTRLSEKGRSEMQLTDVAAYYRRSATAARYRAESRIDRDANKQAATLRARANSTALLADLEEARDVAIAEVIAAESATLMAIQTSLNGFVTP